jgi:hypothetical protein
MTDPTDHAFFIVWFRLRDHPKFESRGQRNTLEISDNYYNYRHLASYLSDEKGFSDSPLRFDKYRPTWNESTPRLSGKKERIPGVRSVGRYKPGRRHNRKNPETSRTVQKDLRLRPGILKVGDHLSPVQNFLHCQAHAVRRETNLASDSASTRVPPLHEIDARRRNG